MPRDDESFGEGEDDATTTVRSLAEHAIVTMMIDLWVRLNQGTETAIDRDESDIGRFRFKFSSKKCLDTAIILLAEKVGCRCFH